MFLEFFKFLSFFHLTVLVYASSSLVAVSSIGITFCHHCHHHLPVWHLLISGSMASNSAASSLARSVGNTDDAVLWHGLLVFRLVALLGSTVAMVWLYWASVQW